MLRIPAVAGHFYPGRVDALRRSVNELLESSDIPRPAIGVISPHAGYVYSGRIAGATFARVEVPERVVILGPNHRGTPPLAALYPDGAWQTPLATTAIDEELATLILAHCPQVTIDREAHRPEHSLEVQLPFIQQRNPQAKIVPLCLSFTRLEPLLELGNALGTVLAALEGPVLLVASSDMTHYESGAIASSKDQRALARVFELDAAGLYRTVLDGRISMCGVVPTVVMLAAARVMGATQATLVRYGNSGEVTGDQSEVVGYAGVTIQ
jgi:hypothetical protein